MLILRRKRYQDVLIVIPGRDKPITISVERFIDHAEYRMEVELSFECDDDIEIQRREVYERDAKKAAENRGNR